MPAPDRPSGFLGPEAEDPAVREVLEGRDQIRLEDDLVRDRAIGTGVQAVGLFDEHEITPMQARTEAFSIRVRRLPVATRVKLAFSGNKEARRVLANDPVKLVQACVLRNPRLTIEEVLALAKNRSAHMELLRIIADHPEWVRNYPIRLALVLNPKTPLQIGLGLIGGIVERDLRLIARSRNIATVIQAQARRRLLARGG